MDLKDFVKSSLSQIAKGIIDANLTLSGTDAVVNPPDIIVNDDASQAYGRTRSSALQEDPTRVVEKVEFDVAVTVQEGESTSAGIKVSVMSIGLGAKGETSSTSGSQSRIKFTVPMIFPSKRT